MNKDKREIPTGMQDLCRKLKVQLDELAVEIDTSMSREEQLRRSKLMELLKKQLGELS
ncbi:MAG TPA: hypothetical protein PKC28_10675 [Bdellovibrionales bacterium]|nr:hypothetical protein [Bdellovibrionales bacterium]